MKITSLQECFALLRKIKGKKKKVAHELVYLETGQLKHSSERQSAYIACSTSLDSVAWCAAGWSSWIFEVGKSLYSVQK